MSSWLSEVYKLLNFPAAALAVLSVCGSVLGECGNEVETKMRNRVGGTEGSPDLREETSGFGFGNGKSQRSREDKRMGAFVSNYTI